jgi:hypothetical protein
MKDYRQVTCERGFEMKMKRPSLSTRMMMTVVEVLNRGRAEYLLEDGSENEEVCELETPKISKVLDSISEVINLMERQSDCDHFHLLHLQNINTYVTKKRHHLSRKKNLIILKTPIK